MVIASPSILFLGIGLSKPSSTPCRIRGGRRGAQRPCGSRACVTPYRTGRRCQCLVPSSIPSSSSSSSKSHKSSPSNGWACCCCCIDNHMYCRHGGMPERGILVPGNESIWAKMLRWPRQIASYCSLANLRLSISQPIKCLSGQSVMLNERVILRDLA